RKTATGRLPLCRQECRLPAKRITGAAISSHGEIKIDRKPYHNASMRLPPPPTRARRAWSLGLLSTTLAAASLLAPRPAHAQLAVPTADASNILLSCSFPSSPGSCGYQEESAVPGRATVYGAGRDGNTSIRLHTEPGDANITGSGGNERDDIALSSDATQCRDGSEQWWAHSIMFPSDFVLSPGWGQVVFDFHNTGSGPGQANFEIAVKPDGTMQMRGY